MALNLRKVNDIPDGSITESKLADDAVTTSKIADLAVTNAKAIAALNRHVYVGDETEVNVVGVTETAVKEFAITKAATPAKMDWKIMHIQARIKTSDVLHDATVNVYINGEGTPRMTLSSTATDYEILVDDCDISDLGAGKHDVVIKLVSADAGATAYLELTDIFTEL